MIPPIESAANQSIGFLVRGDVLQRDMLQTLLQKMSNDVSRAHVTESMQSAESRAASSSDRALVGGVPESKVVPGIAAAGQLQDKTVAPRSSPENHMAFDPDDESSGNQLLVSDSVSLAILESARELLPQLAAAGLCGSLFVCIAKGRADRVGIWGQEVLALLIPLDGSLSEQRCLYACGFSRGFDAVGVEGVHGEGQDVLVSLPELRVVATHQNILLSDILITENQSQFFGRGHRLGETACVNADHYVMRLDTVA